MKTFIVEITYLLPSAEIAKILSEHRKFLQTGYDRGLLLCSGPKETHDGGMVVARASSQAELEEFFNDDPYRLLNAADYRIVEFNPVLSQDFIKPWLAGE